MIFANRAERAAQISGNREHVRPSPAGVAELTPQVEILGMAADIGQAVDGAAPAQDLAARPVDWYGC